MIYNEEYKIKFYCNPLIQKEPVREYIEDIYDKDKQKVQKYIMTTNKKNKYIGSDFSDYLAEELKNPHNKSLFDEHGRQLEIAYQILQLRKKRQMSQAALAEKIGSTQSNVARMEGGNQNFSIKLLNKVALALKAKLSIQLS